MLGGMRHTAHGWWLEEAGPVEPRPPLASDLDVDVAIVGGGYTGMWTAWHVLAAEPEAKVALLEADVCGHGPSGRNGGFCETLWVGTTAPAGAAGRRRCGQGRRRVRGHRADDRRVVRVGGRGGLVPADAPFILASTALGTDDKWRAIATAAREVGRPEEVREADAAELRRHCDSPAFYDGIILDDSATVHPARLALGLRAQAHRPGRPDLRAHARARPARTRAERGDPGDRRRARPREGRGARARAELARAAAAAVAAVGDVIAHRADPAAPRRDRGARLDRRRIDHGRPRARAPLPHHPRRPDRVGGRRPAGGRRADRWPRRGLWLADPGDLRAALARLLPQFT